MMENGGNGRRHDRFTMFALSATLMLLVPGVAGAIANYAKTSAVERTQELMLRRMDRREDLVDRRFDQIETKIDKLVKGAK